MTFLAMSFRKYLMTVDAGSPSSHLVQASCLVLDSAVPHIAARYYITKLLHVAHYIIVCGLLQYPLIRREMVLLKLQVHWQTTFT